VYSNQKKTIVDKQCVRLACLLSLTLTNSGIATGWTGVDMSAPLLLEVAPEIDTNPTSFYRGGVGGGSLRLQTPAIGSRSALAMSVHPTYFDLATPLLTNFSSKAYDPSKVKNKNSLSFTTSNYDNLVIFSPLCCVSFSISDCKQNKNYTLCIL